MTQSDTKTVYDMKNAKFAMEKEIEASIEKFSKEYPARVHGININTAYSNNGGFVSVYVSAEVKL